MGVFTEGWYVAYTRPRHEKKVAGCLSDVKIDNYLPMGRKLTETRGGKQNIDFPLFPSYIFIFLKDVHSYYQSMSIKGVVQFLKFGNEIPRIKDSVISDLKLATLKGKDIEVSATKFQPGQRIWVSSGPLAGLSGEINEINGQQKLVVRVCLLHRNVLISVPSDAVLLPSN